MYCNELFKILDRLEERYIHFWQDICNIESPTDYKEGLDRVGQRIAMEAESVGLSAEFVEQEKAGNLVKVILDNGSKEKPIIISAHIDTVHPVGSFGNPPVKIADGIIYGPGVMDDKGGAAAAIYAMAALKECGYNKRNIIFIAQTDEEVSSRLSNHATINYMIDEAQKSEVFLNCEPNGKGNVTLRRKGIARYQFQITGKAAHASYCFAGASAVLEAAYKIIEIEKFKNGESITCSCSLLSGGEVSNSVPIKCEFSVDVRFFSNEQFEEIDAKLKEIAVTSYIGDTSCKIECISKRPAMELTEQNLKFLEKINRIYEANGIKAAIAGTSFGGSDAANISSAGVTTVDSIGCEGGGIHSVEEFAYIKSLKESAKRIASIIYCYDIIE